MKLREGSVVPWFLTFGIKKETTSLAFMLDPLFGWMVRVRILFTKEQLREVANDKFPTHRGEVGIPIREGIVSLIKSPVFKGARDIVSGNLKVK